MNTGFEKFSLTGKTAFVTGGGTGLGYFMSRGLVRSGANVIIAARRAEILQQAAATLEPYAHGNKIFTQTINLKDRGNIAEVAQHLIATHGGVDILVGNAAQELNIKLEDFTYAAAEDVFQVNVFANMALVQAFLPHMRQSQWGRIIFSSSIGAIQAAAQTGMCVYSASKAALNGYMRVAAAEAGHDGITVNCLNLGMYKTEMLQHAVLDRLSPEAAETFLKNAAANNVLGRLGECEEVESLVQLLASDAGSYISGAELALDGGLSILMRPNFKGS